MHNLAYIEDVKGIQSNLHATFDTPQGKEVLKFLESICGWYDFSEKDKDMILIKHGSRQVLATIKSLLKLKPEQVVALAQEEGI